MKIVVLAGGSGTRLWPCSRRSLPKQFLHFGERDSLLQKTLKRFLPTYSPSDLFLVTNQDYFHHVLHQVKEVDPRLEHQILVEPESKGTAAAIAFCFSYFLQILDISKTECCLVVSSDHLMSPVKTFLNAVQQGIKIASNGKHVIFGVVPQKPETGYGYIKMNKQGDVDVFVEKPTLELAETFFKQGDYLWNAGIFLFQIQAFLEDLSTHAPEFARLAEASFDQVADGFSTAPNISIDCALLEKSKNVAVLPLDVLWSDVGSWDSIYDVSEKDKNKNVKRGNVLDIDTKNSLILGEKRLISIIGLEDVFVVETGDAILVGKRGESERVKQVVDELKKQSAKETSEHPTTHRPWGKFTVLEEGDRYKIKRITVIPGHRLSLQKHFHRSEHWVVVQGVAKVTVGDEEKFIQENESLFIAQQAIHRLENPGKTLLELIEVQVGEYLGEDDIIRFEDDYARLEPIA